MLQTGCWPLTWSRLTEEWPANWPSPPCCTGEWIMRIYPTWELAIFVIFINIVPIHTYFFWILFINLVVSTKPIKSNQKEYVAIDGNNVFVPKHILNVLLSFGSLFRNSRSCLFSTYFISFKHFKNILICIGANLYTNTVLGVSVRLSVCLFVRYRNHLPVVQFQN